MKTLSKSVKNEILEISFTQKNTYSFNKEKVKSEKSINFYFFLFIAVATIVVSVLTKLNIITLY